MPGTTKKVSIVLAGSGAAKYDVDINRGTTARDLLERLHLQGYLRTLTDPSPLGENEAIYSRVQDGEKLLLSPPSDVA